MENQTAPKLHLAFFSNVLIVMTTEVHWFFQHLLNTYYMPGSLPDTVITKTKDSVPTLQELSLVGKESKQMIQIQDSEWHFGQTQEGVPNQGWVVAEVFPEKPLLNEDK